MRELVPTRGPDPSIADLRRRLGPNAAADDPNQPRYVDWFEGQHLAAPARIHPDPVKVVDIHEATRKLTCAIMEQAGTKTYSSVAVRMPESSRLRRAIEARALDYNPLHGVCRVGRVILGRNDDEFTAAEFYVTNFDAKLDTASRSFYTPTDRKGGMFFGVGVIIDKTGRPKRFDRHSGREGMYFQTKDLGKAIYAIASISTGMSIEQLMEIDRNENNSVKRRSAG
ncbi:hypothetical protein G6L37_00875 [Agrobacterium rubi]|nr:hypothetical protein [Agrobacterium rubi]NTF23944.1 hypothetical protein [Agrobacterium rubi]